MKKGLYSLISSLLITVLLLGNFVDVPTIVAHADESKILTLGANLSPEQKELVLNYLGVDEDEVVVITVTNEDEHALLDGIATPQQIETRTFSCCYIEPTSFGGIHIKTVNLSWVTCEMIRNALVTSGIVNCNIVCVSPIEVSGTGSLTGIFKAYENISGEQITEEKQELASEELITTCTIAGEIGQDEASSLMGELKEEIITNEIVEEEDIFEVIQTYIEQHNIELKEEQVWDLVDLLLRISQQEYDIEEVKQAYADIKQTVEEVKEAGEKTVGFFAKIGNFFKTLWQKITGTYDKFIQSEQAEAIKDTIGILAETNDSLLGDNTVVTDTIDEEVKEELENAIEEEEVSSEKESDGHWYDFILNIFNKGNKKSEEENVDTEETETPSSEVSFDDFQQEALEYEQEVREEIPEEPKGLLDYVTNDFEESVSDDNDDADVDDSNSSEVKSFDDLTK